MLTTLRRLAAGLLFCAAAQADPSFTWYLMPGDATLVVGKPVYVTAILINTGTTTITGLAGYTAVPSAVTGYFQTYGIAGGAGMEQQFAGIKLAPGESFFFTLFTFSPVNAVPGTLGLKSAGLTLRDATGVSASIPPRNNSFTATLVAPAPPQCRLPVWSDEFDGTELDSTKWNMEGWGYPGALYFTARPDNVAVSNGNLLLIARRENYRDAPYTTAQLNTMGKGDWRYGRMEARMRLPTAQGMWPAFWLLSTDKFYGATNPQSGEIDILELIGREPVTAHATVHTVDKQGKALSHSTSYNLPSGRFSDGYHVFALEWDPGSIRIFVDDIQYYNLSAPFPNGGTWPFDKRFNIILSLGVGGDWPGPPDKTTLFPQTLEVDYVRVFQKPRDITIVGPEFAEPQTAATYRVPDWPGATYQWTVDGAEIDGPADSSSVTVNWGDTGGQLAVHLFTSCGEADLQFPVTVTPNLWRNADFSSGYSLWNPHGPAGVGAFSTITDAPDGFSSAARLEVLKPTPNYWDVQLVRNDFQLAQGQRYRVSFWGRKTSGTGAISVSFHDTPQTKTFASNQFTLTADWRPYSVEFTPSDSAIGQMHVDVARSVGTIDLTGFVFERVR